MSALAQRLLFAPRLASSGPSSFASSRRGYGTGGSKPQGSGTSSSESSSSNPTMGGGGKVSFKDLGATRTVKVVVIGFLSIVGTLETYTYGRWLYGKFSRKDDPASGVESTDMGAGKEK